MLQISKKPETDSAKAFVIKNDILITSTGEGTIGRVVRYPYGDPSIADGHVTIVRLQSGVVVQYVLEFLRSEYGQIQMLRSISGSTGQTELLANYIQDLIIAIPSVCTQNRIVREMGEAREKYRQLRDQAHKLQDESSKILASARHEMVTRIMEDSKPAE